MIDFVSKNVWDDQDYMSWGFCDDIKDKHIPAAIIGAKSVASQVEEDIAKSGLSVSSGHAPIIEFVVLGIQYAFRLEDVLCSASNVFVCGDYGGDECKSDSMCLSDYSAVLRRVADIIDQKDSYRKSIIDPEKDPTDEFLQ